MPDDSFIGISQLRSQPHAIPYVVVGDPVLLLVKGHGWNGLDRRRQSSSLSEPSFDLDTSSFVRLILYQQPINPLYYWSTRGLVRI